MEAPLILHVYNALGMPHACLLEETKDGTFGLLNARCNCLAIQHARGRGYAVTPH